MVVKVIATDMDGTFLDESGTYDKARFAKLLTELERRKIRFVAASGNQCRQLREHFIDCHDRLTLVGENGAHILDRGKVFFERFQAKDDLVALIKFLEQAYPQTVISLAGKERAYMRKDAPRVVIDRLRPYYPILELVDSFLPLPEDDFFKLSLEAEEEQIEAIIAAVTRLELGKSIRGTSSGFGCIDFIAQGLHKGWALESLLEQWGCSPAELMAFGDSGNDLELLGLAKYSYAMENAAPEVQTIAHYRAPSNKEAGVLTTIEAYLAACDT